jgi:two-component system cell cycle sensor histidine kinase/response regulator CckA
VILLVEDNVRSRHALAEILVRRGHEVIQASDGEHAITMLAEGHPITLVITDLAMPKITGFGVLTHIHQRWPKLPVILTTGYLSPEVAELILSDNVKFLSKPIDFNELFTTIEGFTASQCLA